MAVKSDIEIAREAKIKPIADVAAKIGVPAQALVPYGWTKAKLTFDYINQIQGNKDGKLILVTAISPTPAGEGKTTTSVGLGDGLNRIGKRAIIALREPSLGPCFGSKGGAAGGGYAQVVPMEDINLHFTGDFHAITSAHNLLSALIDNHIYWGNALGIDERRVSLEARARRQRSRAPLDRQFARRRLERLSARGRLRHHGRLGSDGHSLSVEGFEGPREPPRQHHRRLYARQETGPRPRV